ncbi:hypothetical protein GCM10011490_08150 [Pseudoclavibacter endophyticus]|nr:hypothetical protein GCM10011490_08150 [Pseudoclavibacter endophyticus]
MALSGCGFRERQRKVGPFSTESRRGPVCSCGVSDGPPARRVIRLFPDYCRDWPLWENSTPTWDVGYTTTPEMYGLSEQLTRNIAAWNRDWESHFDPFEGWDDNESRERWRLTGEDIAARLRAEVAPFADVSYEPWPLGKE